MPRILTWSSDPKNPIGAEYIIEEKATGVKLGSLWGQWARETKLKIITQVAEIEQQLTSVNFKRHGAIYFKEDIQGQLENDSHDTDLLVEPSIDPDILARYALGPLTSSELWQSGRTTMELGRGPCMYIPYKIFVINY